MPGMLSAIPLPNWNQTEKNPISRTTDSGAPPTLPHPATTVRWRLFRHE
jgi:hypothetical protein